MTQPSSPPALPTPCLRLWLAFFICTYGVPVCFYCVTVPHSSLPSHDVESLSLLWLDCVGALSALIDLDLDFVDSPITPLTHTIGFKRGGYGGGRVIS